MTVGADSDALERARANRTLEDRANRNLPPGFEWVEPGEDDRRRAAEAYREAVDELRTGDGHPNHGPESCYMRGVLILALFDFRARQGIREQVSDLHPDEDQERTEQRAHPRDGDPLAAAFSDLPPGGGGAVEPR